MKESQLFTPVKIGPLTLRNRTIRAAAFEGMCSGNAPTDLLYDYHRSVARGGIGMTTLAYASVTRDGLSFPHQLWLRPEVVPGLRRITDAIHSEGAAASIQIGHCGNMSHRAICGCRPVSASSGINIYSPTLVRGLRRDEITEKAKAFGDAVRLVLDTLECGEASFAMACLLANRKYDKNNHPDDIKSHQYIISFDPRDAAENGLTMEKAQALGLNFCKENFPGHPAIVCTHPDGHNHSGNIHVHIVIGSVRTREVERKPYMQKPRDWREGMKHSSTAQTMRHLRVAVMEMCQDAKLYQIDLLSSKKRVSEREYWMKRRSQMKLDRENAALLAAGQQPTQTEFETAKETLRKQISDVLDNAASFEDFSDRLLQQYGITVKESRGRLSYLPAGRTKFIRAHSIGDKFEKGLVLAALQENAERKRTIQFKSDRIGKLVDIQAKLKQGKGIGYERWAKKFNLKRWSQTLCLLQEKKLLSEDALNQRIAELKTQHDDALAVVKDMDARMVSLKELRGHLVVYRQYKPLAQKLQTVRNPAKFKEQHRAELAVYEAACAYFKANGLRTLPDLKKLDAEYQTLSSEKNGFYTRYKKAQIELRELRTAQQNVEAFFRKEERNHAVPQQEVK